MECFDFDFDLICSLNLHIGGWFVSDPTLFWHSCHLRTVRRRGAIVSEIGRSKFGFG